MQSSTSEPPTCCSRTQGEEVYVTEGVKRCILDGCTKPVEAGVCPKNGKPFVACCRRHSYQYNAGLDKDKQRARASANIMAKELAATMAVNSFEGVDGASEITLPIALPTSGALQQFIPDYDDGYLFILVYRVIYNAALTIVLILVLICWCCLPSCTTMRIARLRDQADQQQLHKQYDDTQQPQEQHNTRDVRNVIVQTQEQHHARGPECHRADPGHLHVPESDATIHSAQPEREQGVWP